MSRLGIILSIFIFYVGFFANAQEYIVKSFEIIQNDIDARVNSRVGNDGRKCALLKVFVQDGINHVNGSVIGEIETKGMEKRIYLTHETKMVELVFDNHFPLKIRFDDYNVPVLTEQTVYVLKLVDDNSVGHFLTFNETQSNSSAVVPSDINIYQSENERTKENTYVVIVGNENYRCHPYCQYAHNDSEGFEKICHEVLKIPKDNVFKCLDATYAEINTQIQYLREICDNSPDSLNIIFYYVGYGLSDNRDKISYLLPSDANGSRFEDCISLKDLCDTFDNMKAKNVTVFLETSFGGMTRDGRIVVDYIAPKNKTIVFCATDKNQVALAFDEHKHGLFTYYLLKNIKESNGNILLKDLADNIHKNVKEKSFELRHIEQTPKVIVPHLLDDSWKTSPIY